MGPGGAGDVWDEYARALIRIRVGGRVLAVQLVGAAGGPRRGPWPFAMPVIVPTAWNPGSLPRTADANAAAEQALAAELRTGRLPVLPAEGLGPDTGWCERGAAVVGMDLAEAVELGVRYGQRALYRLDGSGAEVVGCLERGRALWRPWRSRWETREVG